jgi:IS30 family transposase
MTAKRRYRRIGDEEKERMVDLYAAEKLSSVQIGRLMDREPAVVRRSLHQSGVVTQHLKWNAKLAVEMLKKGVPMAEVSRIVGKSGKVIRQYIRRHSNKN